MGLMQEWGKRRFSPGKGVTEPSPKRGPRRFFFLLGTYFWQLIGINLLFTLCCLPLVTVPASLCALNRYCVCLVREGVGVSAADYWAEWKRQLLHSLPAGVLCALPLLYAYYLLSMAYSGQGEAGVGVFGLVWALLGLLFGSYVFVLYSMLELPLWTLYKNAAILMCVEWKTSLVTLALSGGTLFLALALFPWSLSVLSVCWMGWLQLALCCAIQESVQRRIVAPYEALRAAAANPQIPQEEQNAKR